MRSIFVFSTSFIFSQTINYNLKKGFIDYGFDVVSYFNNEVKEGSKQFTATHNGVKFKFSSKENLMHFYENPNKYIPQYGGYCAYAVALKGDKVPINP